MFLWHLQCNNNDRDIWLKGSDVFGFGGWELNAGIDFLEFKPSEIAAAVAISVTGETKTVVDTEKAISLLTQHVKKVKLVVHNPL